MSLFATHQAGRMIFAVLLILCPCLQAVPAGKLVKYANPKVRLYTDLGKETADQVMSDVAFFETFIEAFFKVRGLTPKKKNPIRINLYQDRADFLDSKRKENVILRYDNAYFTESNNRIVACYGGGAGKARAALLRECARLILRRYFSSPPPWLDEGLACYFEGYLFDIHGHPITSCGDYCRIDRLRSLLAQERLLTWESFFLEDGFRDTLGYRLSAYNNPEFFAQSWGVFSFYLENDDEELRAFFDEFLKGMRTGRARSKRVLHDIVSRQELFAGFFTRERQEIYKLYRLAVAHHGEGNLDAALQALLDILGRDKNHLAALRLAAEVTWEANRFTPSLSFWRLLAESEPENSLITWKICRCLVETGSRRRNGSILEEALEMGKKAVRETHAQDPDCLASLAMAHKATGNTREALNNLRKAIRLGGASAALYKQMEEAYSQALLEELKEKGK